MMNSSTVFYYVSEVLTKHRKNCEEKQVLFVLRVGEALGIVLTVNQPCHCPLGHINEWQRVCMHSIYNSNPVRYDSI